jgi:hypothetical protein
VCVYVRLTDFRSSHYHFNPLLVQHAVSVTHYQFNPLLVQPTVRVILYEFNSLTVQPTVSVTVEVQPVCLTHYQ